MSNNILLLCQLLLIVLFIISGLTKLFSHKETADTLKNFGVSKRLVHSLAILLPVSELTIAILLLDPSTLVWGARASLIMLVLFTSVIVFNLQKGNKPQCRCFGALSKTPISWKTILRNFVLIGLSIILIQAEKVYKPSFLLFDRLRNLTTLEYGLIALLGVLITICGFLISILFNLWRQQASLLLRVEGLEAHDPLVIQAQKEMLMKKQIGKKAPVFSLSDTSGTMRHLSEFLNLNKEIMLIFTDPDCGPCNALLPLLAEWQKIFQENFMIILISRSSMADNTKLKDKHQLENFLVQKNFETAKDYNVDMTPSSLIIDKDGYIKTPVVVGLEAIAKLVEYRVNKKEIIETN